MNKGQEKTHSDKFNDLAELMKKGDKRAAGEIYDYFSPLIYRFVLTRVSNKHLAEDLSQDVFVKVVSRIDTFNKDLGNFSGWIWQITRNTLIDYYRDKKEVSFSDIEDVENEFGVEDNIYKRIEMRQVKDVIKGFGDEERELFALYYLSDLSYRDISKIMNKSEGALRVATHRLLKKIKEKMTNDQQSVIDNGKKE